MTQRKIERIRAKLKRTIKQMEKLNVEFEFCMEARYPLSSKKMILLDKKMQKLFVKRRGLETALGYKSVDVVSNPIRWGELSCVTS